MKMIRRLYIGLLIGLALSVLAPGADAATVLSSESRLTTISAYGGHVVWSGFDPARRVFRLKESFAGRTRILPVRSRRVAFDVDLGPDRRGQPVAVYSRCRREPPNETVRDLPVHYQGRGCDVYRFDFTTGRERRVDGIGSRTSSETLPSIWKDRIAFSRVLRFATSERRIALGIYVRDLRARRTHGAGRGSAGAYPSTQPHPTQIDLRGTTLAFSWGGVGNQRCQDQTPIDRLQSEIWSQQLPGRARRVARTCEEGLVSTAALGPGNLTYLSSSVFASEKAAPLVITVSGNQQPQEAPAPVGTVAYARDAVSGALTFVRQVGQTFEITAP